MNKLKGKPILYYISSFVIPMAIMLVALAGLDIAPFGDKSLVISDGHGLYLNYLGYVGRAVKGQEGILYSFEKGLGGNMMSSWGWFLLNPFFVVFSFYDVSNYIQAYTWVSVLSLSICGLTMYILLKDIYGHRSSNLVFSTSYALNGFLVANVFQMNFFSVIPMLPIMVMGLRRILKDRNPIVYIFSIAYSMLMNFYFGFMVCVASGLFFLVYYIINRDEIANEKSAVFTYILSSICGVFIAAIVWFPAILGLRGGRLDQSIANFITAKENMPFLDMFSKLFIGANSTSELSNGLPNIFVGILPVFLLILFFMNTQINKKSKITAAVLLVFYLLSFYMAIINILMHGGTVTNWFNYRDSFVFCFLILMIAAEEWQHITEEPLKHLKRGAVILIVGTMIVTSKRFEYLAGGLVVLDFLILGIMYLAYRMHKSDPIKNTRRTLSAVVLVLVCVNLFLNYYFSTKNIMNWSHEQPEYQQQVVPVSVLIDSIQKTDDGFYRMEVDEQRSGNAGNDPMLYGYNGVGHGGSDERDFVRHALSQLGIRRYDMRNSYGQGVPAATDSLLGLKYIISKENLQKEKGYEKVVDILGLNLYKNNYALPIGFVSNDTIETVELNLDDIFANLNMAWASMTGDNRLIFAEEEDIEFTSHNIIDPVTLTGKEAAKIIKSNTLTASSEGLSDVTIQDSTTSESTTSMFSEFAEENDRGSFAEQPKNMHSIKVVWTADKDGAYYSYNRSGMTDNTGSMLPALNYEGYHYEGETITRYLPVTETFVTEGLLEDVAAKFRIACVDNEVLMQMSECILSRPSSIEKIKDNWLRGTVTIEDGQELIFSIPYDSGWTLYVDGQKTPIKQVLGAFMAAELAPGEHTYEFKYMPSGLVIGMLTSTFGLLLTVCFLVINHTMKKKTLAEMARTAEKVYSEDTILQQIR